MNHIANNNRASIQQMAGQLLQPKRGDIRKENGSSSSFEEILSRKQEAATASSELKFSKHAAQRLTMRNISLSAEQLERLESGTNMAQEKGIKESLVMVDDLAFIVNIKNRTVVTAVNELDKSVFTNIDGAVIN